MKHLFRILPFIAALVIASCSGSSKQQIVPEKTDPPTISFDKVSYTVKLGKSITITPVCRNVDGATYSWVMNGSVISTGPSLTFQGKEISENYITLTVTTKFGSASKEIKVTVAAQLLPKVLVAVPDGGFTILKDSELKLTPTVENETGATYIWYVDNTQVATTKDYTYKSSATGTHTLKVVMTNEDGSSEFSFAVKVCAESDMPFSWNFESDTYNYSTGRTVRILIRKVENAFDATYKWVLDGVEKQNSNQNYFLCNETAVGAHTLVVTMTNKYGSHTKTLTVNVCPAEGTYKRMGGTAPCNKVYEFTPAPGQFINEGYTATTQEQACKFAEDKFKTQGIVSLGAWGGYIVVGFDHSIVNDGGYNIAVTGNSFTNSSEPGIVWVMQDENGNGLPDDTWYELKGSDYSTETRDYSITYYKPTFSKSPVLWTSSDGKSGSIDYLSAYHTQNSYFPAWVSGTYTLYGSSLISKTVEVSKDVWHNRDFDWGYADNFSSTDRLSSDSNSSGGANDNHFKISDAVRWDGTPANLQFIDFVKVQTGVSSKAGWIGELSTEVLGVKDYNLLK